MNLSRTDRILASLGLILLILAGQFAIYQGVREGALVPVMLGSLLTGTSLTLLALSAIFLNDNS